jgi:hypothetical protein
MDRASALRRYHGLWHSSLSALRHYSLTERFSGIPLHHPSDPGRLVLRRRVLQFRALLGGDIPAKLAARCVGLAQAATGIGKIAGPLCLALIAGTTNLITPKATLDAGAPAFLFLAAYGLAIGLAFTLLGIDAHGKPLVLDKSQPAQPGAEGLASSEEPGVRRV